MATTRKTAEKAADAEAEVIEREADDRTVVQRILDIASEVGAIEPTNTGGVPFPFRGIDRVVASLTPLLNKHRVFFAPIGVQQLLDQRQVGAKVVTKADLTVTYRAYGEKGDYIDVQVPGQADDFADRSTAQAMSVAFRILLLQLFHIPAFGNEEAASEETKTAREAAAEEKITKARGGGASTPSKPKVDPAEQMREAILAAAAKKGWGSEELNEFGTKVTGKEPADFIEDPDELSKILDKITEA